MWLMAVELIMYELFLAICTMHLFRFFFSKLINFIYFFQNAQFSALIFDKLQVPDYLQKSRNEGESRCDVCATHLNQLKQEAVQMIQTINQAGCPDILDRPQTSVPVATVIPRLSSQNAVTVSSPKELLMIAGQVGRQSGKSTNIFSGTERRKGLGWPHGQGSFPSSSVQVTVGSSGIGGALSSVTIQAQQYLEGMWSISRVNSFLPPSSQVSIRNTTLCV